ncbi:DUF4365 domain-containing protein [Sphingobacterium kitahiroshimense]|uniref:DUF4365 domain-containing protein n=1 Tax=Sphingobacterium sp. B16(2022) TaxID=2914044 RepID=UPI00143A35EA|nr:DUF4365 domain-containing protein [Sphingobacterium sp. B16(2022)]NJI73222.1 DUF4365 domain-containing protein [Sphingobacterium sp. B16(2022)]
MQHRLEDLSIAKFQLILPQRWVFRTKNKDYGIDGEVELFDEDDKAQGLIFYVQLKATGSKNDSIIMNVDLDIDVLRYYSMLDIPVLLVRYSEFRDSFYVKWIYNVDLSFSKKGAKKFRIKIFENDLWDSSSGDQIERRIDNLRLIKSGKFTFPIQCSLIIDGEFQGERKVFLDTQIKKELNFYSDSIRLVNSSKSIIEITLDTSELRINFCGLRACSFHSVEDRDVEKFAQEIAQDILIGCAICMVQIGQIDYCGRIIYDNNLEGRLIDKQESLIYLLSPLFKSSYFNKTLDLIGGVLDINSSLEIQLITQLNILKSSELNNKSKISAIEAFFVNRLKKAKSYNDKTQIGIAHYNLANHYRGQQMYYESVVNFVSAKRFEPRYEEQDYYYAELAGIMFILEKYQRSARFYKRAIDLGATGLTIGLYADALMFSGDYQEAVKVFEVYLNNTKEYTNEFFLKFSCLKSLTEKKKILSQKRDLVKASLFADLSRLEKGSTPEEFLEQALDTDLLCGLAWYNYGLVYNADSRYEEAMFSFTMAGLVQNNDIEAWINATKCCLNIKSDVENFILIISVAYLYNGEDYLENLYKSLMINIDSAGVVKIKKAIELVLSEQNIRSRHPIIRVMNENGKFINIFENQEEN